jgi:hypothetical protein
MSQTLRVLGVVSLLMAPMPLAIAAGGGGDQGGVGSRATTGMQTGSQQTNIPATGGSAVGMSGPTVQPSYPGTVGPTGSDQPDATNPDRSSPAGGGGSGK